MMDDLPSYRNYYDDPFPKKCYDEHFLKKYYNGPFLKKYYDDTKFKDWNDEMHGIDSLEYNETDARVIAKFENGFML